MSQTLLPRRSAARARHAPQSPEFSRPSFHTSHAVGLGSQDRLDHERAAHTLRQGRRGLDRYQVLGDGPIDVVLVQIRDPPRPAVGSAAIAIDARSLGLELRVGLHTGEVELVGHDIGGIAVHIAARVAGLAAAGEVLVSSTTKELVAGSGLRFVERGTQRLTGISDEWRLFLAVP